MARKLRPYAQIYATAAKKIGLRVVRINDQTVDILHKKNRIRFFYAMCSKNDSVSAAISRYKFATNAVLKAANLPVFEQQVFNRESKKEINAFIKKIKLPVVVKPADSFQGDGITVNITSLAAVHEAVDIAHRYSRHHRTRLPEQQSLESERLKRRHCRCFGRPYEPLYQPIADQWLCQPKQPRSQRSAGL